MPDDEDRYMSAERKRILWPLSERWLVFAISIVLSAFYPLVVRAQSPNVQYTNKTVDLGLRGNLTVNPSTRALEIQIPLGGYAGRAGLDVPIAISYSSKVHRIKYEAYNPGQYNSNGQPIGNGYTLVSARFAEYSSAGWTSSVGFPVKDYSAGVENYFPQSGQPAGQDLGCNQQQYPFTPLECATIDRMLFRMPDGSTHELRSTDQPRFHNDPILDNYYSVDGSRMRYQSSTQTLFMADGSRYNFGLNGNYVDRNGNTITSTDTLGRAISNPPMNGTGSYGGTPGDYPYSVPGVGVSTINYTLKWRYLDDPGVLTSPQPLQYVADSRCPVGNGSYSPHLFLSDPIGTRTCIVNGDAIFRPVVLYQIVLPTGQAYTFTYNIYGEIDRVVLPTGGYERYEYDQVAPLTIDMRAPYLQGNRGVTRRYVSASGLAADEVSWQYSGGGGSVSITAPDGSLTTLSMYTDFSLSTTFGYSLNQAKAGRAFAKNFYSPPDGNGVRQLLRRHLSEWSVTGSNATSQFSGAQAATRNARLTKEVEIIFDTGGPALARSTVHEYDTTYQFSTGVNETVSKEYDYVALDQNTAQTIDISSVPTGTLLRRTEKTYLDATNQAYRDRNLLGLVNSVTVKDAVGNTLAQSSIVYDEGGQFAQLNDYGNVVNWTDPQTTVRGNPTTMTRWLNFDGSGPSTFPNGTYLTAHAQYDQCGSVRKTWDARDTTLANPSQVSYSDAFSDGVSRNTYAFPTSMTTAVPDPNATYGSNVAFTTTSVYDFNTSRVISATDANGQTTNYDFTDPLNRIRQVTAPNGARVRYNYSDTPGDLYVQVLTDEDIRSVETRKYFDNLGRGVREFLYDGTSTPWSVTDIYYDTMGRVSQVSNPYRVSSPGASVPATCSVCTTSAYDALGRVTTVTTPDGAQVTSAYAGNTSGTLGTTVTVTDQAGKLRRSLTDATGRLMRVDEPDKDTGNLDDGSGPVQPTYYSYDILGNLKRVDQGTQHRYFLYDSLSRLIRARNPEQGVATVNNLNDPYGDPAYPNSQWSTAYAYDSNGNLLTRTDARGVVASYIYDQLNRNTSITYTNDPAGTPAVSRYYDGWRGGSYNSSIGNSRGRLWQTETAGSTGTRTTIDGYDLMGRPVQQEQQFKTTSGWSSAYITSYSYDLGGHVTLQTYPSGHAVAYNYDIAGRLADKDATHLAFTGNLGNPGVGSQRNYSTGILYDAASRMTQEQFGTTTAIFNKLSYNSRGQLAATLASTSGNDTTFNRGKIVNDYSGTDNNGNLIKQTVYVPNDDQNNSPTSWYQQYEYDSLNRLTQVHEHASNTNLLWRQQFVYDRYGNRRIEVNNTSTNIPRPDFEVETATNRLLAPGDSNLTGSNLNQRKMRYDDAGNLVNDNWSSYGSASPGVATRTYDAENRMTSAQDSTGGTTHYTYDADGRRVRRSISGQPEVWQVYGLGSELLAEYAANADHLSPQKEYGYRNGQLLVTATVTSGWGAAPTLHDNPLVANETTVQARHITELRDAINALRSHLNLSPFPWQYSVTTNDWVTANPILEMRTALDQALGAPSGGYSAGLAQYEPVKAIHIQELRDRVLAAWSSGSSTQINWMVTDQLGTPRMIFDQSGSLANMSRHDYLPFGEELFGGTGGRTTALGYANGDGARQRFTQKERDNETGLDYFGARYYASTLGRFTSPDPLLSSGRPIHPQSWNRYSYVINQPLSLIDPDGLDWGVANWYDKNEVHHTDYQWFNGEIGEYDGHSYTAVNFGGDASRTIDLSDGRTIKISNDRSNPLQDITAHPQAEQAPILPSSWIDHVPIASTTRSFFFNYTTHNFEGATVDFLKLSVELGTLPVVGEWAVGKAFATKASEAIFYSGGKAAFQAATEAATNEGGKTVGMTIGGRVLNKFTESRVAWDWASKKFAQGASGEARVFLRQPVRLNSTWTTVEYPILRVNPFVRVVQR